MEKPLFSIVIPTKNRGVLVGNSIDSVLSQSFTDRELIVVDNDDAFADLPTSGIARGLPGVRYYRTGGLSMPDNWQYGVSRVCGKYLIILQDKMTLKPDALMTLAEIIKDTAPDVIKWQHDFYDEDTHRHNPNFLMPYFDPGYIHSGYIISLLLNANPDLFSRYAPIGIDTCVSYNRIVPFIDRLCQPVSPDYTMAYQILHTVSKIYCIPDMLTTMSGMKHGNGISFFQRGELAAAFIRDMGLQERDLYSRTPLPIRTTYNSVINDYSRMYGLDGLNRDKYYRYIYDELKRMEAMGVDVREDLGIWGTVSGLHPGVRVPVWFRNLVSLATNRRWSEMVRYVGGSL